ncbi:MAG: hypothetical protein ABR915_03035 [Thermoguttaceae bacterium]
MTNHAISMVRGCLERLPGAAVLAALASAWCFVAVGAFGLAARAEGPKVTHDWPGYTGPSRRSRAMRVGRLWLTCLVLAGSATLPAAEPPFSSGDVTITLDGGAGWGQGPFATVRLDMLLDFALQDGKWQVEAWGDTPWFNCGHHSGQITKSEQRGGKTRLSVVMNIEGVPRVPGGKAQFDLELDRKGDRLDGAYRGTFLDNAVEGKASGQVQPALVRQVPGFAPLDPGEHPRLIFRKRDLAAIKRRAATPEGKAILEMLTLRAPVREVGQAGDRRSSWIAANWGAVYQLTGDQEAADKARRILVDEIVKRPMPQDRADLHIAPRLLGAALAYDLCYDAWDAEFRAMLTGYLRSAMLNLYRGVNDGVEMAGFQPEPWTHANAVRMGALGCLAIALLGEKDSAGKPVEEAAAVAKAAERDVVKFLRLGLAQSGKGMEGDVLKALALSNGVLPFLHAAKTALGRDLSRVNPFLLAGHVLEAAVPAEGPLVTGLSSISVQASGRWAMGLGTVPADFLPAMKWCFDRECGLLGKGHFDCAYPFHAAYMLANYPFDTAARPPQSVLPLAVRDDAHGRHVFRSAWKDRGDIRTVVNLRSTSLPGWNLKDAELPGVAKISGFGPAWLAARLGIAPKNDFFGGETLYFASPRPQQYILGAKLDRMYWDDLNQPGRPRPPTAKDAAAAAPAVQPEAGVVRFPYAPGAYHDLKIKCTRHLGIDYSGASGAPALVVLVEQAEGFADEEWSFVPRGAKANAQGFTVGDAATGATMAAVRVAPANPPGGRLRGSGNYFFLFTVQVEAPPKVSIAGEGIQAKVAVGGQTVRFDGEKIVFEK